MAVSNTDNRVQYSITSTPTTSTEYSYPNRVSAVTDIVVQETTQTPRIPGTITFNQSSDQFALTNHGLVTGNVVQFDGTAITGFTADIDYYVVKIDANSFQLATSVANATASPPVVVEVGGSGNVSVTTLIRAGEQPLTRTLTKDSDYTITPETSGTLITSLVVNPTQAAIDDDKFAVGSTITIYRETNFQQTSNYVPNQIIPADTLEGDLDKLAMMAQQLKDDVGRSVRFAESVTDPANLEIAFDADQRSGKLLSFDADGNFSVSQEIGVWRSAWQSGRAYSARDLVFNDDDTSDDRYSIYFAKTAHTSDSSTAPLEVGANWDKVLDASFFATQVELAQTSGGAANDAADLAEEWASKTDGIVDSTDYSSKAYAIGGTGVDGSAGSAKDWAIKTDDTVDGTNYSAKYWATQEDVGTVAANIADINAVADIDTDVSAVAAIDTAVSAVNTNATNINTVAGQITPTNNVSTVAGVSTDITTVAGQISPTNNISTVAGIDSDIQTVAGVSSNVTTVAGISTNVTTVAGVSTDIPTVAGVSASISTVAGISADVGTVAGISTDVTAVSGISSNVTAVAGNEASINTVAGISADVTTVAGDSADIQTVATNILDVNNFADTYLGAQATDPSTTLDGALYFNTTSNELRVYDLGTTTWIPITSPPQALDTTDSPTFAGVTVTTADINGGTVDGTTIGGTTPAAGTFSSAVVEANTSSDAVRITQTGTGNALVVEDSSPDSTPVVVDASGRLLVGGTTARTSSVTPVLQTEGVGAIGNSAIGIFLNRDGDASGPRFIFTRTRGAVAGSSTVVADNDSLGRVIWYGADGTDTESIAALVECYVDGTPGTDDMPGRLVFSTTADGESSPTERMLIDSSGNVGIGTDSPSARLHVANDQGGGPGRILFDTNVSSGYNAIIEQTDVGLEFTSQSNSRGFVFNIGSTPTEQMRIDSSGNVGIGGSPSCALHVKNDNYLKTLIEDLAGTDTALSIGSGVNGVTLANNTAGNQANEYITLDQSTDVILLGTSGTERMRIDSSGNVGIGTNTVARGPLHVHENSASDSQVHLTNNTSGSTNADGTTFYTTGVNAGIFHRENGYFIIATNSTERMRIDSSGVVYVGMTGSGTENGISMSDSGNSAGRINVYKTASGTYYVARFFYNGTSVGGIQYSNSSTSYQTSSDYRLKEDVQPMSGSIDRLKALNPVNFAWKIDGSRVDGFLAHEAQEVVPEAVSGEKDAVDADGNPEYQGVDYGRITPLLTSALQDAIEKIEMLERRIAELETR